MLAVSTCKCDNIATAIELRIQYFLQMRTYIVDSSLIIDIPIIRPTIFGYENSGIVIFVNEVSEKCEDTVAEMFQGELK